jgi:hypothetical protein
LFAVAIGTKKQKDWNIILSNTQKIDFLSDDCDYELKPNSRFKISFEYTDALNEFFKNNDTYLLIYHGAKKPPTQFKINQVDLAKNSTLDLINNKNQEVSLRKLYAAKQEERENQEFENFLNMQGYTKHGNGVKKL